MSKDIPAKRDSSDSVPRIKTVARKAFLNTKKESNEQIVKFQAENLEAESKKERLNLTSGQLGSAPRMLREVSCDLMDEYRRYAQRVRLKELCGQVTLEENWREIESAETDEYSPR